LRALLALTFLLATVFPVYTQSPGELRAYLAEAIRLIGECPTVKLDERVARQVATMAGIADIQSQMRPLGERQLALSDAIKPPPPPSPAPAPDAAKPLPPPITVRPKPRPTPCQQAIALYGPNGSRLAGLISTN
jgi:hypothetical protein